MIRRNILETAANYVSTTREADYGTPEDNFKAIADLWGCWLGIRIDAHDVAIMMTLLKIGRIQSGAVKDDNYIDGCGYMALGAEIKLKEIDDGNKR